MLTLVPGVSEKEGRLKLVARCSARGRMGRLVESLELAVVQIHRYRAQFDHATPVDGRIASSIEGRVELGMEWGRVVARTDYCFEVGRTGYCDQIVVPEVQASRPKSLPKRCLTARKLVLLSFRTNLVDPRERPSDSP